MGYFNWFYQFKGHIYLNEKPFFPIRSNFPAILVFWGHLWGSWKTSSDFLKFRLYHLLYSKRPSPSQGLKNRPPWAEIFAKIFLNIARQTNPATPFCFFLNISAQGGSFLNLFLHWTRGIKEVVLSTIKGTKGVLKNRKILPASLKNPKLQGKLELIGKKDFSFRYSMHQNICYTV